MNLERKEVLNEYRYWIRCTKLLNISKITSIKELSLKMNYLKTNPHFLALIKFLKEKDFIEIDEDRTPYLITINQKKLAQFLRESEIFKICVNIIEKTKIGYRY